MKKLFILFSFISCLAYADNKNIEDYDQNVYCSTLWEQTCDSGYFVMKKSTSCMESGSKNDKTLVVKSYQVNGKNSKPESCIMGW